MNSPLSRHHPLEDSHSVDVYQYHQRSKHALDGYAKGPATIDWDRQPDPFRRFESAPIIELPLVEIRRDEAEADVFASVDLNTLTKPNAINSQPLTLEGIARWLQFSLALSAWKQYGHSRWSLRCNPSSGNLHPTEAYLVILGVDRLADGLYHYRPDLHALEQRCCFPRASTDAESTLYLGFSSLHWREAWKYGERAYRYCQLDVGHALAGVGYAAAMQGWSVNQQPISGNALAKLLGLDRGEDFLVGEEEWPEVLLRVCNASGDSTADACEALLELARQGEWQGRAAVVDRRHFYDWPVIAAVAEQAMKPADIEAEKVYSEILAPALPGEYLETLADIIPHRRSAQAFDGKTEISREQFFVMLDHLMPRAYLAPWSSLSGNPAMHCVLFVHRVRGLAPGLYAFPRTPAGEEKMRAGMRDEFLWEPVVGAPSHLHLFCLVKAKAERTASKLSCQQAIAADGAFSLAMLAEFTASLDAKPWRYPHLYWEAGAIGQVLYLEAEGIGMQGTGIGCYFDDAVHQLLGIEGEALQVMYHFTVGSAVRDPRIVSFAPYGERRGD